METQTFGTHVEVTVSFLGQYSVLNFPNSIVQILEDIREPYKH